MSQAFSSRESRLAAMLRDELQTDDALVVVDAQVDFLPGGALAVPEGDAVVPVLNGVARQFRAHGLPIFATRDWHPPNHCSFVAQGGPWPPHCIADTPGARFAPELRLPAGTCVIDKATRADADAYSGFEGTDLAERLRVAGIRRVFVGGLATDYCVLQTVLDALRGGFSVCVLCDAVRAVDVHPGDGDAALEAMQAAGARLIGLSRGPA